MRNELLVRLDECGHEYGCLGAREMERFGKNGGWNDLESLRAAAWWWGSMNRWYNDSLSEISKRTGQRQKCVNAQIPIVRSWPWLPGCVGASFEIVEMTSKQQAGPVQLCSIMTGQRVAHPGDHYPPILLVAQHLVSHSGPWHERRFLVTCSLTGEGGGIVPIHECLRYLHCTLLEEKNASWCTCCEHPSTSTFLTNVHRTSCKNQGRFTAYKSLGSALACDSCPRKRKRRGKIFVYCKTSFPCPLLLSNLWVCSAIKNQISWWI